MDNERIEARECLIRSLFPSESSLWTADDVIRSVNGLNAALTLSKGEFYVSQEGTELIVQYIELLEEKVTNGDIIKLPTFCRRCGSDDINSEVQSRPVEDQPCQTCKGKKYIKIRDRKGRKTVVAGEKCPNCG